MKRKLALHRSRSDYGQSLVELAFVLPLFLMLIFGLIDLGRGIYALNTVSNAARIGARLGVVDQSVDPLAGVYEIQKVAAHQAVGLGVADTNVVVSFEDPNNPGVWCSTNCPVDVGWIVRVKVPYQFTAAVPAIGQLVGSFQISSTSEMRIERVHS